MTEAHLQLIVGLISGVEASLVTTLNALHDKGLLPKQEVLPYFDLDRLPPDQRNGPIGMVFRQIAAGIDASQNSNERADKLRQLFRVVDANPSGPDRSTDPSRSSDESDTDRR